MCCYAILSMQPDKLLGILPLSVLLCNPKYCNLRSRPISGRISKRKLLFCNVKFLKKLKLPTYQRWQVYRGDPLMWTTTNNSPAMAEVDAIIPRCHNLERIMSDLAFELKQHQPVRLIITANHRRD